MASCLVLLISAGLSTAADSIQHESLAAKRLDVINALTNWSAQTPVPEGLVAFNSSRGEEYLIRSDTLRSSFMSVMQHLETQNTQTLCGAATCVTILNALPLDIPQDPWYYPYHYFTQEAFFSSCVANVIPMAKVLTGGMTLEEVDAGLKCWGAITDPYFAGESTEEAFVKLATTALADGTQIAANFLRTGIDQEGGGHWSPIAAYEPKENMFLLLDVSRYKYPPVWVPAKMMFDAMNTMDSTSGKTRGFIFVSTR